MVREERDEIGKEDDPGLSRHMKRVVGTTQVVRRRSS